MTLSHKTASRLTRFTLALLTGFAAASPALAEGDLNLYSSRHYDTDERLYEDFEKATGITINRIEAKGDELIARMRAEGANSPADVLITVDAGLIWRAEQADLFQPIQSDVLEARLPDYLRDPEGKWFGFSQRARMIFYSTERVATPPKTYEDLADPQYKGKICTRSSTNIYMLSLMASIIENDGEEAAQNWAQALYDNRARDPQGGDTDQLRGIVSGECDIVLANSYYFARGLRTDVKGLSDSIGAIGWVFPNQSDRGTHVNISGAGVAKHAPNRENAIKFLEYLTSRSAQEYFSAGNDEYPAVPGVGLSASVAKLGLFRSDALNLEVLGRNQAKAQAIYDAVGYK
ncbi:MAG: Fe(3+) ABC transporter substrate-binding protein [Neomegalonema sp.]|nr:Fe(3+) ABC transporter substrate-binding protein [Neomegalonema sp.]